jgi:hypothetical protein
MLRYSNVKLENNGDTMYKIHEDHFVEGAVALAINFLKGDGSKPVPFYEIATLCYGISERDLERACDAFRAYGDIGQIEGKFSWIFFNRQGNPELEAEHASNEMDVERVVNDLDANAPIVWMLSDPITTYENIYGWGSYENWELYGFPYAPSFDGMTEPDC